MTWDQIDWAALDRLRDGFLRAGARTAPYWTAHSDLASYDFTFGERIGWKWDAVLDELGRRGWHPPGGDVLDWGCGSGVAGRRVVRFFGPGRFAALRLWDHSAFARDFAARAAATEFPGLAVSAAPAGFHRSAEPIGLLIVSHVLNELSPEALSELCGLVEKSRSVLWVEPGTRETSRRLGGLRDEFAAHFTVVAPCTHSLPCPMFAPGNERHWCHHFAPPPPGLFADSDWVKFGQRAGIDLRSLPYAFIALDRRRPGDAPGGLSRVIGRPERHKVWTRLLNCDAEGLQELSVPKRRAPALYKELDRTRVPLVYRWRRHGSEIEGGTPVGPPAAGPADARPKDD